MDLREVGNLFMVGFYGDRFSAEVKALIEDLNPCGVILFSRNIQDPVQIAQLTHDLQRFSLERGHNGLFIGVDQEGGRVRRLREPFSEFPPARTVALSADAEGSAREFARVTARELRLVGFNLDFVPVLDVLGHPDALEQSVIGDRSYGSDPALVSRLGRVVLESFRSEGVIPCCKHFPGHGGTQVDSHKELPMDDRTAEVIEQNDLVPFVDAVEAGTEMIMTAHILYPFLDRDHPATLSHAIISGLLRRRMGYDGVVVSDDLDMGAVANQFSTAECALMAIQAGVDIPLICNKPEKAFAAAARIVDAIKDRDVSKSRMAESLRRIKTLKGKYAASMNPSDVAAVHRRFGANAEA
ncbi:MAG: beta-N-acetylhexosaminidase [Desulfomonile tiedjei]|nr:beta-N-acetylhexosaminidase [Desulfomonile tiedjei]